MPELPIHAIAGRYWRMLRIRWQRSPLESGSHLFGGRFNRIGQAALYLSADHATAIAEFHQVDPRPGTLVGYQVEASRIADLTDPAANRAAGIFATDLANPWVDLYMQGRTPPTWPLVDRLIADGAHGALYPSMQRPGGINLVLWQWGSHGGASVTLIDPDGDLRR